VCELKNKIAKLTRLNFIYQEDDKIIAAINDLNLLFDIFKLADKYIFDRLKSALKTQIEAIPLHLDNYATVHRICSC
jgi:hypothetical protein